MSVAIHQARLGSKNGMCAASAPAIPSTTVYYGRLLGRVEILFFVLLEIELRN
jgi:hypothetical protein